MAKTKTMTATLKTSSYSRTSTEAPGSFTAIVRLGTYCPNVCFSTKLSGRLTLFSKHSPPRSYRLAAGFLQ